MKRWAVLVLLLVMFAVSVLLTGIEGLVDAAVHNDLLSLERLGVFQGRLASLLTSSFIWSRYPALPPGLTWVIGPTPFLATVPLLLAALYFVRIGGHRPFPLRIAVCLAVSLVSYAVGAIALHGNTATDSPQVGQWLGIMILGPLYSLVVCALLCIVELLRPRSWDCSLYERIPLECSPVMTAAPHQ
jgi:hypothetical protein